MKWVLLTVWIISVAGYPSGIYEAKFRAEDPVEGFVNHRYETPEGVKREEALTLHRNEAGEIVPKITGKVSWTSPEGRVVAQRYEADEKGYRVYKQPTGVNGYKQKIQASKQKPSQGKEPSGPAVLAAPAGLSATARTPVTAPYTAPPSRIWITATQRPKNVTPEWRRVRY